MKLCNNEGIWRLCPDVVSSLSYTQWSVLEKESTDVEFRTGYQPRPKIGDKGKKAAQQGRKGQKNQPGQTEDMVGAVECAGGPWGADGDHDERSTR